MGMRCPITCAVSDESFETSNKNRQRTHVGQNNRVFISLFGDTLS